MANDGDDGAGGAWAETVGPASVEAARRPHRYPRPKYAGGATGDVLSDAFGPDAA